MKVGAAVGRALGSGNFVREAGHGFEGDLSSFERISVGAERR